MGCGGGGSVAANEAAFCPLPHAGDPNTGLRGVSVDALLIHVVRDRL
jgi:hypothetical protein